MSQLGKFELDGHEITREIYYALCVLFANKEIARKTGPGDPIAELESRFRGKELSGRLLSIAVKIRVLDDQMKALPPNEKGRQDYFSRRNRVDRTYANTVFDELKLREVCNKIIHATIFELYEEHGREPHEDCPSRYADLEDGIDVVEWKHYRTDWIRIGNDKEDWYYILDVSNFASAVLSLVA